MLSDKKLLNAGKKKYGTDMELAKQLGITRQYVCNFRRGMPLSENVRNRLIKLLEVTHENN